MRNTIACLFIGTVVSFLFNYYLLGNTEFSIALYNAFAFGLGWAMAYFVDRPSWPLAKKLGLSLVGIVLLVALGFIFFDFEIAVPSVIKFSTVFVAYYLIASFRPSKSLRN
ncbi:hypothetical protein [Chryseobacterium sp. A301]